MCDRAEILSRYPFVTPEVGAMLHVPRAGWLDAGALGQRLLDYAAVDVVRDRVVAFEIIFVFQVKFGLRGVLAH